MQLRELEQQRESYKNIAWITKGKSSLLVHDMEYSHLVNAARKCAEKIGVYEYMGDILDVPDSYQGMTYQAWVSVFKMEINYRIALQRSFDHQIYDELRHFDYYDYAF